MSALTALEVVHHLTVIEGGKSRRGRPPKPADETDIRLELAMRTDEERARAERMVPLRQQAMLFARRHGPATFRLFAALDHELSRHARAWQEPEPERVA